MPGLPTGTVTFLFTDIQGSTRLLESLGDRYANLQTDYRQLLRDALREQGGQEIDTQGDAFFAVFPRARDAIAAALAVQRACKARAWPERATVRLRMGLHTGEPLGSEAGYVGMDVHRAARICAAAHGGQILLSQTTRDLVEHDLPKGISLRDLGTHRLKDLARPQRLFQVVAEDLPADFPLLKSLDVLPNNLPVQLTSFIGRERETAEAKRALSATRLLTLVGAGGSGKTRLALRVAADLVDRFPDGVWLVDVAPLSNPALVPQTVASVMRIPEDPKRPVTETLCDALHYKSLLLVLDNCEHVLVACAQLAHALLQSCPDLRVLATSREAMGIAGEAIWPVPTLALPDPQRAPTPERLAQNEAVGLFIDRARSVQPAFEFTHGNASAVAEVCRQLDGIPLAIELAAARTKVLSVEQIAARLDDRFRLLAAGSRTAPPRHQTLRAAMDWSHDLLSEREQTLLRRLSVFAGGFALEAVESICGGHGIHETEVLDLLTHLVDKSMVLVKETDGTEARYRLLETIRQYAAEKLAAYGELASIRTRHRDWFLAFSERVEPRLRETNQEVWLERLAAELDNLRAALEWCKTEGRDPEPGLRLAGALGLFWDVRGYYREARQWLEEMLANAVSTPGPIRAKALNWAGVMVYRQGDYRRVKALSEEALTLCRAHSDRRGAALALHYLGHIAQVDRDFEQAAKLLQESVDLFRENGDKWGLAYSLNCLGDVARNQGANERAGALLEEAVALWRDLHHLWGMAMSLQNLGHVVLRQGDFRRAKEMFAEGLANARAVEAKPVVIYCIAGLAGATAGEGRLQHAARLFGASQALFKAAGVSLEPADRADYERNLARVRAGLHEQMFSEAWTAGESMSFDEAVEFALSGLEPLRMPVTATTTPKTVLTPREQEVAALIARGLTNREISAALVITERTAETHVQNILNKLGFNSRAQIAAWTVEHGLYTPAPD